MNIYESVPYKGCRFDLVADEDPSSPREWDNLGTMVCWHRRYDLGDVQPTEPPGLYALHHLGVDPEHLSLPWWQALQRDNVVLPLYLYDHSGTTISTKPFSCPWDSGQIGFIYCSMKKARVEYPGLPDEEVRKKTEDVMRREVETYDAFLHGLVVGFIAYDEDDVEIDSCWGFYPEGDDYQEARVQAMNAIDSYLEDQKGAGI